MATRRSTSKKPRQHGILGYLGMRFILPLLFIGLVLIAVGYSMLSESAKRMAVRDVAAISRDVARGTTESIYLKAHADLSLLSLGILGNARTLDERFVLVPVLSSMLNSSPILYSIFAGYEDGDIFLVVHVDTEEKRAEYAAPPGSEFVILNVDGGNGGQHVETIYLDRALTELSRTGGPVLRGFDPRARRWYTQAMAVSGMIRSELILMTNINKPAKILAQKARTGGCVLGIAFLLGDLSDLLRRKLPTPGSHLALFRADGTPIASDQTIATKTNGLQHLREFDDFPPPIRLGVEKYQEGERGDSIHSRVDGREWLLSLKEFDVDDDEKNFMVLAIPRDEILSDARGFLLYAVVAMVGILFLSLPVFVLAIKKIIRPLNLMAEQARHPHENGDEAMRNATGVKEIDDLARGIFDLQEYLGRILAIVRIVGTEQNLSKLFQHVFSETVAMSGADGGAMILMDEKGEFRNEGYYYWIGGTVEFAPVPDENEISTSHPKHIFARAEAEKRIIRKSILRSDPIARLPALMSGFDNPDVGCVDVCWVALHDRTGAPLGLMGFFQRAETTDSAPSIRQMTFWESLAVTVSVVLETQHLIQGQYELRDALIHILAGAIDAKSPYTGGHCARVPVIFQMILQAACDAREGPLADFRLDDNKWEEARLAGWLHDCGKVTTPEYVMDKATKLETLYDRIHEIRTRFEVLKRDVEIASLNAVAAGADPAVERRRRDAAQQELDDDFAFVASCNSGDAPMDAASLERLAAIGRRVWRRTLDKRLGVSRNELARMNKANVPPPPAFEPLLADSPEHIIERGRDSVLPEANPWGFKLAIPEHLYNRGELYNIAIPRGTLTPEERYKINDHITQTIMMLKRMPLPKELAGMPEIAGAHHETMDGRGYPRKLTREQMSWSARMMAVADIFEALTAWDRPYKSSKTLSEALAIMDRMKENRQIDPDVYDLFLRAGIPQRYAAQYLRPEQNNIPPRDGMRPAG